MLSGLPMGYDVCRYCIRRSFIAFVMRLDGLELTNFHKFEHFSIDFDERMTVLVGENGSGKSSVLDAARIALEAFTYHIVPGLLQRRIESTDARISRYGMGGITDRQEQYPVIVSARGLVGEGGHGADCLVSLVRFPG